MRFDTKIAIVVRDDLAMWQKLNVACFLAGGLVGASPELAGENYVDGSGRNYGPLVRQPMLIYVGSRGELTKTLRRAVERGITASIYTSGLFATGNDRDNRAVVEAVPTDALASVRIARALPTVETILSRSRLLWIATPLCGSR